ncbi:MAG: hypothetical protein H6Q72_2320 [Firmicutes bacterium]|nr:hypothetical protein [Bacillota bacterium]
MLKTGKKLMVKVATVFAGIIMLVGIMAAGGDNRLPGTLKIVQASPVEDLNITSQQKTEIEAIFRQASGEIKELKKNTRGQIKQNPFGGKQRNQQIRELREQIQTIRTNALENVRKELTPSQQTTFGQFIANRKGAGENRKELLKNLELTRQQKQEIAKINEKSKVQIWDVFGDSAISIEQKVTQIKKIKQASAKTVREQLTANQQTQFDAWQQRKVSAF